MKTKTTTARRALALCMSVLMLMTAWVFVAPTKAAAADAWSGVVSDPGTEYVTSSSTVHLYSARALVWFVNRVYNGTDFNGQTVYLDVDVDLKSYNFSDNVLPGDYNDGRRFKGTFDGQNHTISNFKMVKTNQHRVAMFRTTENATFKNLVFNNVEVSSSGNYNGYGVLAGYHASGNITFENVHINSGTISGYNYVGALVGEIGANSSGNALTMTNCSNGAAITGRNVRIGGLVGSSLPAVNATNCTNTGNVTSSSTDVGGIVGWIEDDPSSFTGCTNEGNVQGKDAVGGIIGYFGNNSQDQKITLINNTNTGNITATNGRAGGIAGHLETDNNAHEISGNINRGTINGTDDTGGIVGRNKGYGVWTNNKNYGAVTSNGDNAGGIVGEIEDDKQIFTNCVNAGTINGQNSTGGIVGWLSSAANNEFTRCFNTGAITSNSSYAGGIEGRGTGMSTFTECFNIGTIQSNGNDSGGLVGSIDYHTFFYRCFNAGSVTAPSGKSAGGMIGYTSYNSSSSASSPQISDSINWGTINGGNYGGGFVGYVNKNNTYYISNSYNAGTVYGSTKYSGCGYGGNIGTNVYRLESDNGGGSATSITQTNLENNNNASDGSFCSTYFVKNTWGVSINGTTYKYPILSWYRDLFSFEFNFVDTASGTNTSITKNYGESFTVPNPTRTGYSAGQWLSGNTHRLVRGATVTAGNTYLTSTNHDKSVGPADTNTVVQSFSEPTEIRSTKTYGLIWNEGAAANMYATSWANEENNTNNRYRAGIDYTIYNLTTGHDVSYTDNSATDYTTGNSQYYKSYQKNGTGNATATLEVDRSKMDDIKDTGIYIDYYPFIYTGPGGVRWGVEIFDPNNADSKGVLNNDHWTATVTGTSGKSYTYEQRFGDVNGNDHRCAETSSDFTQEPSGTAATERRYGSYKWYFKGAAPDVDDSVTLRITAICAARYNSGNLQILSEWTDLTITGICSHSGGHLIAHAEKAVSCEEAGNSAYWECDVCHKYFSDADATNEIAENSWVIPATGHDFSADQSRYHDLGNGYHNWACANDCGAYGIVENGNQIVDSSIINTYSVTFNANGTGYTVSTTPATTVNHGGNVTFAITLADGYTNSAAPTCTATNAGTVTTSKSGNVITYTVPNVTDDTTITLGTASINTYTVTFYDEDGTTVLKTETVNHGADATPPSNPNKQPDATNHYAFAGWDTEYTNITADTNITATYTSEAHAVGTNGTAATCGAAAVCGTCGTSFGAPNSENHAWGAASYNWTKDENDWKCTATRTCSNTGCPVGTQNETVTAAGQKTLDPTCTAKGKTTYTATFTNAAFTEQTKVESDIPATGHSYAEPAATDWTWTKTGDTYTATVVVACEKGDDTQTLTATVGEPVVVEATHLENGSKTYTATATIGEQTFTATKTDTIAAEGHSWQHHDAVGANDCQHTGTVEYWSCTGCDELRAADKETVITSIDDGTNGPHTWEWVTDTDATCGVAGKKHEKCKNCDATRSENTEIPATGNHTPGEAVRENEVPATCSAAGSYDEVVYCSVCNEELSRETKTIDKLAHTPGEPVRENEVPASCSAEGSYDEVVYCTVCNEELSRETKTIDKLAHTPGDAVREKEVPASCSAEGSYDEVVYCSVCGEELSRETKTIEKTAHTPGEAVRENEVPATCTAEGSYDEVVYCSVCNEELSRTPKTIDKLAHTPGDAVREKEVPASCSAEGSYDEVVYCTACNTEISRETKTIDKLAHTPEVIPGKAATCTEIGLTEGSKCSVCGEILTAQQPIEKLAHTPGEAKRENEVPATCSAEGSYDEVVYCTACNTEISRETKTIEKLQHKYTNYVYNNDATCTADGTETAFCDYGCGTTDTRTKTDSKLGHDWGEWVITKNATCTTEGSKTRTCKNDSTHVETKAIAKTAHTDANGDTLCDVCGQPMANHQHTDGNGDGKCDTCGRDTDAHRHTDANGDNVCDNCGKTINTSFRCSMCDYNDQHRNTPVFGWFVIIIHFFVHLFAQMKAWV